VIKDSNIRRYFILFFVYLLTNIYPKIKIDTGYQTFDLPIATHTLPLNPYFCIPLKNGE